MDHLYEILAGRPPEVPRPHHFPGDEINLFLSSIVEIRQHRGLGFILLRDIVCGLAIED